MQLRLEILNMLEQVEHLVKAHIFQKYSKLCRLFVALELHLRKK